MQLVISIHNDVIGWVAFFGAKRGANSMYKREAMVKMGEKRRKTMEGGVERWEPLRCQLTTAIIPSVSSREEYVAQEGLRTASAS